MHILQVLNTLGAGGAEAYVVHLSNDLVRRGAKVTVVARGDMTLAGQLPNEVDVLDIGPLVGGSCRLFSSATNLLREVPELGRFLGSSAVTVIHTHLIAGGLGFWVAGRLAGVRSLHTAMHAREIASRSEKLAFDSRIPGRLVNRFLALSDWSREDLIHKWHIPRSRVVTIRSGVDVTRFQPNAGARAETRASWGVGPDTLVCGAAASLTLIKGLALAVQSVAHAVQNGASNLTFVIAGRGPEEENLKHLVARAGIAQHVRFLGYVSDTSKVMPGFDVYLQTTVGPNLGFSSLEALSTGVPLLIAVRSQAERAMAEDTLINDKPGWIEDATPTAMGACLLRLYRSPDVLARKKLLAREIGVANYSWGSHVGRLINLYEEMSAKRSGA
jgi:glycosyltransferase involved in cell wall biosynthesis